MEAFVKAKPVWLAGRQEEYNLHAGFKTVVRPAGSVKVSIAAFTMYRLFVNNSFVCFGPARAAKGYHRIDSIDITSRCTREKNVVAVEVVGQNSKSYAYADQTSFFACEIAADGRIVRYTGDNGHFTAGVVSQRIQRTQRFSFQRAFWEAYRFEEGWDDWRAYPDSGLPPHPLSLTGEKRFIKRYAPYPEYERLVPAGAVARGTVTYTGEKLFPDFFERFIYPGPDYKRFDYEALEVYITDEAQRMRFTPQSGGLPLTDSFALEKDGYITLDMGRNATGMTAFDIEAREDVTVFLLVDEILSGGDVDFLRAGVSNVLRAEFKKGRYRFMSFEPLGYRFAKVISKGGSCVISGFCLTEYKHPPVRYRVSLPAGNERLRKIYDAAVETYRQNSVDIFMDCPSRERAGWLCDSFFTARVERCLTGESRIEQSFLENFLLPEEYDGVPRGMLPMCYPADHTDLNYIPNWAMWLVCQLAEYKDKRNGDRLFVERFRGKVYALWEFFKKYENEYGLLEKLDKWVFVEWSKANELVQDVNYPTNMLYAFMLGCIGALYGDRDAAARAEQLRETVCRMSYNGEFFTDNAVRKDGALVNTGEATEVCQYYAFFFGTATPKSHPELWNTLLGDFGPDRGGRDKYPHIYPANMFIGNYLRLDVMMRYGEKDAVLEDIEGYFYDMACRTGTLWEHYDTRASCNHGFASHVVYWLCDIFGKDEAL